MKKGYIVSMVNDELKISIVPETMLSRATHFLLNDWDERVLFTWGFDDSGEMYIHEIEPNAHVMPLEEQLEKWPTPDDYVQDNLLADLKKAGREIYVWEFDYGEQDYIAAATEQEARDFFEDLYKGESWVSDPDECYVVKPFFNLNKKCFYDEDTRNHYSAREAINDIPSAESFPYLIASTACF